MTAAVAAPTAADSLTRAAWLAWRRRGIGASDAGAIAGVDPWRGAMSVWLDKSGRIGDDDEDPEYRRWGNLLEPAIVREFEARTGLHITGRTLMLEHSAHPWMRATIDGLVVESMAVASPLGVLEIKTVAGFKGPEWNLDGEPSVPEHFQLQVQHQLAVTGLAHAWLAVLFGGQRLEIRELERDDDLIASLIDLEDDFWQKHVLGGIPPAADGLARTTSDLRWAFADPNRASVDLPAEVEALIAQRLAAQQEMKASEAICEQAEQALMALLGDAEVGLLGGQPRVTWKRYERSTVNLAALRAKHPAVAKQLTVKSGYRVLRLVGAKGEES